MKKLNLVSATVLSILIMGASGRAEDSIIWPYIHFPTLYIAEEGKEPTGYGIDVTNYVISKLPEYKHSFKRIPPKRLFFNLKQGYNHCFYGAMKKPDREEYLHYSLPAKLSPPTTFIVIRKNDLEKFGGAPLSFRKLLKNKKLKVVIKGEIQYTKELNAILDEFKGQSNIHIVSGDDLGKQELKMLIQKRIDYTVYVTSILYEASKLGIRDKITLIPLQEKKSYEVAYFVCPKNEWGKQIIDKIDDILRKEVPKDVFFDFFKDQVTENNLPEFREQYQKLIIEPSTQQ
ncbi:MAG: hypothetical protein GY749_46390 [Desulfobacteraceae bacterium]|nr:hypothetical protein [Desulfobacteraceae bacterium]